MARPRLVATPIVRASMQHRLAPSKPSAALLSIGRYVIPAYLLPVLQFRSVTIQNPQQLIDTLQDFQQAKARLIIAFRHSYGDEPQLLYHVFENLISKAARRIGKPLQGRLHIRPVHNYSELTC